MDIKLISSESLNILNNVCVNGSVAEGNGTEATGESSHAEGDDTKAHANQSHTEGSATAATAVYSHAEGRLSRATASAAHAEGYSCVAGGAHSHAEGSYNNCINDYEHAEGRYGISIEGATRHTVGIGTSSARKNAHTITTDGKHYIPGIGTYTGTETTLPSGQDLATLFSAKANISGATDIVVLSQSDYDAITTKDTNTLYFITS